MGLDPDFAEILEALASVQEQPWHAMTPDQARAFVAELVEPSQFPLHHVEDVEIGEPEEGAGARVYRPSDATRQGALLYLHGGGWVTGDLDTLDDTCRRLAAAADCTVVSLDYRLAPEHPFPAPVEDAYSALSWIRESADELGIDPERVAVGGDSAGANLAAALCLLCRERSSPQPIGQLLVYPALDYPSATGSMVENAEVGPLSPADVRWFWDNYLPSPEARSDPLATPLNAGLEGLPPALVMVAELDPLRDDGERYCRALTEAGCRAELRSYAGVGHGFFEMASAVGRGEQAVADAGRWMREELSLGPLDDLSVA